MDRTIVRLEQQDTHRPFHQALLSDDALFWSRFERSFSTSFGQRVIEKVSRAAAIAGGATEAKTQKETVVQLPSIQLSAIENHISGLRGGQNKNPAGWIAVVNELRSLGLPKDECISVRVISDLWWLKDGINHYMSIKTVKPNIDQTAEAKRDLLKLALGDPDARVYFGLYYNPFGESRVEYAWSPPKGIFDFARDPSVLIGKDYWDTLGGTGFYEQVLDIARRVGKETRKKMDALR